MNARPLPALLAVFTATAISAQEPPAHLPICVTDSAARHLEAQVRYLLAGGDPASQSRLAGQGLTPAPADSVALVSEERLCTLASIGYATAAGAGMTPPFPVAVVRAPGRLLVQLGGKPEVVVLDESFRPVGALSLTPAGRS